MQTVRSILQISNHGVRLTDEFGSTTGVDLELMLGTAVRLEFDLRGNFSSDNGELTIYPADTLDFRACYFALDTQNRNSGSPALLKYSGITLERSASGHNILVVELENNATGKIISAISGQTSGSFRAEIGGVDAQGITLFAWQFDLSIRSRVFIGEADETVTGDPAYYTAVQTLAMLDERCDNISTELSGELAGKIANPIELQFSADGTNDWHDVQNDDDKYYRQRIANLDAQWSGAIAMLPGIPGEKGDPGEDCFASGGGTLTGTLYVANNNSIMQAADNGALRMYGGSTENAPAVFLFGKDTSGYNGHFFLRASDGTNKIDLTGRPDGQLRWNGKDITLGYPVWTSSAASTTSSYTAAADGWIGFNSPDGNPLQLRMNGYTVFPRAVFALIPVKKGDIITTFAVGTSTAANSQITFYAMR